jgi:hypothetical protein
MYHSGSQAVRATLGTLSVAICAMLLMATLTDAGAYGGAELKSFRLAAGSIQGFHWSASAYRNDGSVPGGPLCVDLMSSESTGGDGVGSLAVCGAVRQLPMLVAKSVGSGRSERTVFAMLYRPGVQKVGLWLRGHNPRRLNLRLLKRSAYRQVRLPAFGFKVIGIAHRFCLVRAIGYGANGRILDQNRGEPCGDIHPRRKFS